LNSQNPSDQEEPAYIIWYTEDDTVMFYKIKVTTDRNLSENQTRQLFGCIGYAFKQRLAGEPLGWPERITDHCWTAEYDLTKTRTSDWKTALPEALAAARLYAVEGTPPRKTKGNTRLVEGLGPIRLIFEFC